MTLEELVGQKLVLGIEGSRLTPAVTDLFRSTHAGGLILFRRNFESAEGLCKLISDIETAVGRKLLVMVDHEGGRVIHFAEGITVFPDAQAAGQGRSVEEVRQQGEIEALELRRLGIDLNLAPVLDVLANEWNPAIGTLSYGKNPELVAQMARARILGIQSQGLSACAKHFPGLGEAVLDPHGKLPVIRKTWKELKQHDLIPFKTAFETGVDCVMSSHPVYSEIDPDSPATFSRRIIHDYLRIELGFTGMVLSDDLKMGAVSNTAPLQEIAPLTVKAGHDLILVCSDPQSQQEAFHSLVWAYKKKDLKNSELEESIERIQKLKVKNRERSQNPNPVKNSGNEIARLIARKGAEILQNGNGLLSLSSAWCGRHSLLAIFPDLSNVAKERFIEPETLAPETFLKKIFSRFGVGLKKVETVSTCCDEKEKMKIVQKASETDLVFFFCWDAHLFPEQRELLKALQEKSPRLVVFLLREPLDQKWLSPKTACVSAYGFRACQIEAAVEKLFSGTGFSIII